MNRILIVWVVLFACGQAAPADDSKSDANTPAQNEAAKKAWEYFPQRNDLAKDESLAKETSFKPPHILKQHGPNVPGNVPSGQYRLCIAFIIEADGSVREAVMAESSGVHALDEAYLAMVRKWRYSPGVVHGKKIAMATLLPAGLER